MRNKTADMKEYQKQYRLKHKEHIKNLCRKNYEKNREKNIEKSLEYYYKNKEICNENSKKNMKKYRSRINSDTNIYLVYDDKGTLIFTFTRKEIINKLGIKNKQFDFALASGTEINGFYFDVEII